MHVLQFLLCCFLPAIFEVHWQSTCSAASYYRNAIAVIGVVLMLAPVAAGLHAYKHS